MAYLFVAIKFAPWRSIMEPIWNRSDLRILTAVLAVFAFAAFVAAVDVSPAAQADSWPKLVRVPFVFVLAGVVFTLSGLSVPSFTRRPW